MELEVLVSWIISSTVIVGALANRSIPLKRCLKYVAFCTIPKSCLPLYTSSNRIFNWPQFKKNPHIATWTERHWVCQTKLQYHFLPSILGSNDNQKSNSFWKYFETQFWSVKRFFHNDLMKQTKCFANNLNKKWA